MLFLKRATIAVLVILLAGCKKPISSVADFNAWLNKEENGCLMVNNIAGIRLSVKYQPPSYYVLKEQELVQGWRLNTDSMLREQNKVLTFLMTIGPDTSLSGDNRVGSVMYENIASYKEYVDRVISMNFNMEENISLYVDGRKVKPLIVITENVYELSDSRNFLVVFSNANNKQTLKGRDYLFAFDDPYFKMGKVQFDFDGAKLVGAQKADVAWK